MSNIIYMREDGVKPASADFEENWTLKKYQEELVIKVIKHDSSEMEFDIIGIFPALCNAFRRILISEVPTMAIEKVTMIQNKTIIPDEILAHRFGLIPLKANPRLFQYRMPGDLVGTDRDTLNYELKVKCVKNPHRRAGHYRLEDMYLNYEVLSKDIKWIPFGDQKLLYKEEDMGAIQDDIVIAKMRPGQELHVKLAAVKGIGKDHAKFSPVGTATYRLHPHIKLLDDVIDDQAERLKQCFSKDVIEVVNKSGHKIAQVKNTRIDMCSRNVHNEPQLKDKVEIGRIRDHYIFTIESVISSPPDELFRESVKIMKKKCAEALIELKNMTINVDVS
ncbi:unnamed protein product [Nezara viridula]|uniref:DNA-directed RNA polymerases I and III subunit RPAC1 n=1 Tax=Nezara viridula TaxID=85310 RepID=A0A9P0HLY5_NEZVI|nr:unnamed protein product [Nezara viridula]